MPSWSEWDIRMMHRALQLARKGRFTVTPNPCVGAVITYNHKILSEGYHRRAGEAHAEMVALSKLSSYPADLTLYVTLEPCCHHGRTPPCVDQIMGFPIRRVVIATEDSNFKVKGKSIQKLRKRGIQVEVGLLAKESRFLNRAYHYAMEEKKPYVMVKWASTLDGYIAQIDGKSQWITGTKARQHGKRLRHLVNGILVGSQTVLLDQPKLTRLKGKPQPADPLVRVLLDPDLQVPPSHPFYTHPEPTWVFYDAHLPPPPLPPHVHAFPLPCHNHTFNLKELLGILGKKGITALLVEGGGITLSTFFNQGLVQEGYAYLAPKILGKGRSLSQGFSASLKTFQPWKVLERKALGEDTLIHWINPCLLAS